jgi:beta-glucosidase
MKRALFLLSLWAAPASAQPWMDTAKTPDERASLLVAQMTQDEKLAMLHGAFAVNMPVNGWHKPERAVGSAGFVPGVPRLGVPDLQETDASLGIANPFNVRPGDTAVALPSRQATAATFNPDIAYANGALLGREAASRGLNVVLGGGVDLARDPRGGRNFEYSGEDPLLAGVMAGAAVRGTQDQHVISTVKHFAMNDQETGRSLYDVRLDPAIMRESDLLAFEIAIEQGRPGAVMCAYNRVNAAYACENPALLNYVLKKAWAYPGFVMSDWGAVHGVGAINAGLDQESGEQLDARVFFAAPLGDALKNGQVKQARVDDAVHRILRSIIAAGLLEHREKPAADAKADTGVARQAEAQGIVLLRNEKNMLPLAGDVQRIAVIGGNADAGVPAGGGSSLVTPVGGFAREIALGRNGEDTLFRTASFDPAAPLDALRAHAPHAHILFTDGRYPSQAALYAGLSQVAIVFATQWSAEASDIPDLTLPDGQDALIERVAAANPHTVVVLETSGPVLMPWRDKVAAVIEAWYPGQGGADAIADVLFGAVNPSGRLPVTFPASLQQLPLPTLPGLFGPPGMGFPVVYPEGADVGYRWYARSGKTPLYPFGFGLSYTQFAYSNLHVDGGTALHIAFDVRNTGTLAGMDTPQAYLTGVNGTPVLRLLGWSKKSLQPGETQHVELTADPRLLADFEGLLNRWHLAGGQYQVGVGADAADLALRGEAHLDARDFPDGGK